MNSYSLPLTLLSHRNQHTYLTRALLLILITIFSLLLWGDYYDTLGIKNNNLCLPVYVCLSVQPCIHLFFSFGFVIALMVVVDIVVIVVVLVVEVVCFFSFISFFSAKHTMVG